MRKTLFKHSIVVMIISMISLFVSTAAVQADSKDVESTNEWIFQNNTTENMRDVYVRRETETKEYNQKVLSNSEESIKLLKEIRDLLIKLNAKR